MRVPGWHQALWSDCQQMRRKHKHPDQALNFDGSIQFRRDVKLSRLEQTNQGALALSQLHYTFHKRLWLCLDLMTVGKTTMRYFMEATARSWETVAGHSTSSNKKNMFERRSNG